MKRISIFILLSGFLICLAFELESNEPPTPQHSELQKPNVIFILTDDLGVTDLSFAGSQFYETPNIDRLASQGVTFTRAYANSAVCSPSRASILTGKFTPRHGITDWIGAGSGENWTSSHNSILSPPAYVRALPRKDISLSEAMKTNGYKTFFAGKWHLGSNGNLPTDHGFDINKGGWAKGRPVGGYFAPWKNPKLEDGPNGQDLTMKLAEETVDFIAKNKDEPFFAFLSFYAVHAPIQTTQAKWKKYQSKAVEMGLADHGYEMESRLPIRVVQDNPVYAGLVASMDEAVGLVLEAIEANGLAENTIIIFTSDHGGVASGDAYATSNLPYRGGKGYQWEGGLRVPLIVKAPGTTPNTKHTESAVTGADLYPTILDLCGLDLLPEQHVDGKSFSNLLKTGKPLEPRPLYWHYPHYGNQGGDPTSIISKGDFKLIYYWEDDHAELYNVKTDIGEQNDLSEVESELANKMKTRLLNWLDEVDATKPKLNPAYNPVKASNLEKHRVKTLLPQLEQKRLQVLSNNYQPGPDWWGSE